MYGSLSAISLLLFTIYTCYLTIMEVITVWEKPIGAFLLGTFLGICQLGHFTTTILGYSGSNYRHGKIMRIKEGEVLFEMMMLDLF